MTPDGIKVCSVEFTTLVRSQSTRRADLTAQRSNKTVTLRKITYLGRPAGDQEMATVIHCVVAVVVVVVVGKKLEAEVDAEIVATHSDVV